MLVLHERKSRVTLAARLVEKTAAETISVMLAVFARIEPTLRKSITFDNDTAFAQHARLQNMCAMTTWFCDAYASWQKGGVEDANGRLRRWLPRQIDIDKVSDEEIQDIILTANLTPKKCLGFTRRHSRRSSKSKTSEGLGHDPFSGTIFIFRSKRADRLKIVTWDGSGLVLLWKRLEHGAFRWPPISDGVMRLTASQLAALVDGMDWSRLCARDVARPTATS